MDGERLRRFSQLDLLLQLTLNGWELAHRELQGHMPDNPQIIPHAMLDRPVAHLTSLAKASRIYARGAPRICARKPEGYFRCLLELHHLGTLHRRSDFGELKHRDFMRIADARDPGLVLEASVAPALLDLGPAALLDPEGRGDIPLMPMELALVAQPSTLPSFGRLRRSGSATPSSDSTASAMPQGTREATSLAPPNGGTLLAFVTRKCGITTATAIALPICLRGRRMGRRWRPSASIWRLSQAMRW